VPDLIAQGLPQGQSVTNARAHRDNFDTYLPQTDSHSRHEPGESHAPNPKRAPSGIHILTVQRIFS